MTGSGNSTLEKDKVLILFDIQDFDILKGHL